MSASYGSAAQRLRCVMQKRPGLHRRRNTEACWIRQDLVVKPHEEGHGAGLPL